MEDWFTVEAIDEDTFAISEYKHWEETHCYLICGTEKVVLIDTGLGIGNIKTVVDSLTPLPVMAVTTHVHWDHIGGHKYFENIAVHEAEKDWLSVRFPIPLQVVKRNLMCKPFDFPKDFILDDYQIFTGIPQQILHDGGCLDASYPSTDPQLFFQSVRKKQNLSINRILPGHHQLSIPVDIIGRIENGFHKLSNEGKLKQGNGVFDFGDFQIHI